MYILEIYEVSIGSKRGNRPNAKVKLRAEEGTLFPDEERQKV